MAEETQKKFTEFTDLIEEKIVNYVKGIDLFSEFDFKNILLAETEDTTKIKKERDYDESKKSNFSLYCKAIQKMFARVMGHFQAGKNNCQIYETIYAYARPEEEDFTNFQYLMNKDKSIINNDTSIVPANLSEEYTKKLIAELCHIALEIRNNIQCDLSNASCSRFFLLGDIGVGKTTFLNNVLSRYYSLLKENNIFWARVDLTKSHLRNRPLSDAMNFQLVRVFKGYYLPYLNESEEQKLRAVISDSFTSNGILDRRSFNSLYYSFRDKPYQKESTKSEDLRLEQGIKKYIEQNYGVMYIFDGLDKIDTDKKLFENKLDHVKDVLSSEKYRGVFIFVMRYASHRNYLESILPSEMAAGTSLRYGNKAFKIVPPKLDEIISRRIDLLFSNQNEYFDVIKDSLLSTKFPTEKTIEDENNIKNVGVKISQNNKDNYEAYLNVFLMFLYKGITKLEPDIQNWDRKSVFTELKKLFDYNYRKLLKIIQDSNEIFLDVNRILELEIEDVFEIGNAINNEKMDPYENYKNHLDNILSKSYRVLDFLVLRGDARFKNPYRYEYSIDNEIKWIGDSDRNAVPYLYNLYYAVNVKGMVESQYNLLLKIRVLQYVLLNKDKEYLPAVIAHFLYEQFNYSKDCTILAFNELYDWRLITDDINPSNNYVFKLSRAGEYHLNTLIYEFSYIRIIMGDILVPQKVYNFFNDVYSSEFSNKRAEKIILQFPKIINFISMIESIEQEEIDNSKMTEEEQKGWVIYEKLHKRIIEVFSKILWKDDRKEDRPLKLLDIVLSINKELSHS